MPIIIARDLPAAEILKKESIFALSDQSAQRQDIRPLKIGIVNLMTKKNSNGDPVITTAFNESVAIGYSLGTHGES